MQNKLLSKNLDEKWQTFFADEMEKSYFLALEKFVLEAYQNRTIFPLVEDIFRAFSFVSPQDVKVVILGQDPYHGKNQAHGLAFSVCKQCKIPPSLNNIYKELMQDIGCAKPANGNLSLWAEQGVLLLNTVFTVEEAKPNSHKAKGWEVLSDFVIESLSQKYEHLVFILWGAPSQKKAALIDAKKHLVITSPHPSPLSAYRGFFGSKPFSKTNKYLKSKNKSPINWCLKEEKTLL